ncbi:type I restriction enzyme system modification protein [Neisseria meningitidis]|nr:type I restriction enzyme system modification protein [Neisseria meningitidis]
MGEKIKDGKKTVLSCEEEQKICNTFTNKQAVEDFSVVIGYDEIKAKNHSLSAGQYFEVKIDYVDISATNLRKKWRDFQRIWINFSPNLPNWKKRLRIDWRC